MIIAAKFSAGVAMTPDDGGRSKDTALLYFRGSAPGNCQVKRCLPYITGPAAAGGSACVRATRVSTCY